MDIRLLDGVKEDLRNGWFFYERQAPGLGDRFLDAIEADVRQLPVYAGIHPEVNGFHRLLIKRFPFALYYRVEENSIDIHAVLDCPRDPNWIRERPGRTLQGRRLKNRGHRLSQGSGPPATANRRR